ncbi:MAG TPA: hypothetical protein VH325_06145 [Bryobacteraceae bacterium]|jgi:hypothetical protein|nr:hypothetical protein [Bryobacteraceae bacterium]
MVQPRIVVLTALAAVCLAADLDVLTNRYDQFTTGADSEETTLNASNVNVANFGKLSSLYVDGAVYAQPLYVRSVEVSGKGVHNVVFAATMNDKLYAFDAEHGGAPLWMRDFTNELAGVTPVPVVDITNSNDLNIVGNVGIEGTPVIDRSAGVIYLVARTKERGRYVQRLHKVRLKDGEDAVPATVIEAEVKGIAPDAVNGMVHFDARAGNQRAALALVKGSVVIAWASHEDLEPYHGWIMTYDAASLKQTGVFCTTPDFREGGIWQSGRGPALDTRGRLYFEIGNGGWDGNRNFGSSVLRLTASSAGLNAGGYFTPADYDDLNRSDADVGSTGPLLIPGTNILVCGNKHGAVFLLDANELGGLTAKDTGIIQMLDLKSGRVMAGPVYWEGPEGGVLFIWCETGFPKAFRRKGGMFDPVAFATGTVASHGSPGGALIVSSNGKIAGTGVLWATATRSRSADHGNAMGVLHAFNAQNLHEIWNSEQQLTRDRLGTLVKFVPPLVAAGRVYVPTYDDGINVYGVLDSTQVNATR